ncbi:CHAT domain-containing protein [Streptomyces sp. NPDC056352]|uniref:CHAT domain-containing protein n=1 Tax=Streptomyces sp. NPDC056352 TaxID=3345791 RepID=UPI0035E1FBCE
MLYDDVYAWEARWDQERELRALRTSVLWHRAELEDEARELWERLLGEEHCDETEFEIEFEEVVSRYPGARETVLLFRAPGQDGLRGEGTVWGSLVVGGAPHAGTGPEGMDQYHDPSSPAPVTEERFLNLALVWPTSRRTVPEDRVLGAGQRYELRLDIGKPLEDSLLAGQADAFPGHGLPHEDDGGNGDWLEVTLISEDFAFPAAPRALFLPLRGDSWVCPCEPRSRHGCEAGHRGRHLYVPFTAPDEPGPARLRVYVSYRGNQLQSVTLTTRVASAENAHGATRAFIDYTLTSGFTELRNLPERRAGVRVGRLPDGTMTVDVTAQDGPVATFSLSDLQVRDVLKRTREVLLACHAAWRGEGENRRQVNLLDANNGKPPEALAEDMTRLAHRGWAVLQMLAYGRTERATLQRLLREPTEIQICREKLERLVFPWGLVYDIPVESQATLVPCTPGWEQVGRDASARSCPGEAGHALNTLCPYGFWGYRHYIEQPPSVPPGGRLRLTAGRTGAAPTLTVARSNRLFEPLAARHLDVLGTGFPRMDVFDRSAALREALIGDPGDCVYFYGHGRRPETEAEYSSATVLEIGDTDRILPEDLNAWATDDRWDRWDDIAPLVFLNGCHTADHDPGAWLGFVDTFAGLHASGVIGTEITVHQALAGEFAERFWELLLAGEEVGAALHRVRMELLRKGNVLGLAYTAYCSAALRLRNTG